MPDIANADKPGAVNDTALQMGIEEKAIKFVRKGADIYRCA